MPNPPTVPRNELGQFSRKENDLPIATVLAQEAGKRADKEVADKKRKDEGGDPPQKDHLEEAGKQVLDDFLGIDREKDKADLDAATNAEADKAKAERAKKREADKSRERPKAEPKEELNAETIARAAAEGVARVFKPKEAEKKVEEPPAPTGPHARRLAVLERMEKLYPDEYKGAVQRFKNGKEKLEVYRIQWEKDHPGGTFDEEDAEHQEFFEKNDVFEFWDEDAYTEALADMRAEKIVTTKLEEGNRDLNAQLNELQLEKKLRESQPLIGKEQFSAGREFWATLGEEFENVLTEDGKVNREMLDNMKQADPIGYAHRAAQATDLNMEVEAIYSLMNGLVKADPKNAVHNTVREFVRDLEVALMAKPANERKNTEGKVFVPGYKYYEMSEEERGRHWTLSARDISFRRARVLAMDLNKKIKEDEARLEQFAVARGYRKPATAAKPEHQSFNEPDDDPDEQGGKPHSPSTGSESLLAARQNNPKNQPAGGNNGFFREMM